MTPVDETAALQVPGEVLRWRMPFLILGILGLIGLAGAGLVWPEAFFRSWLMGFIFWLWVALGALGLLGIQHLAGGRWSVVMRRPLEAASRTIPVFALLFIPLLFGMHELYEWTHAEVVAGDAILQHKAAYLNVPFYIGRAAFFFILWSAMALLMSRWTRQWEATDDKWAALRVRRISGGGLVMLALTGTFASVDWMMSIEPHWFSTMYGLSFVVGCLLSGHAFTVLVVTRLVNRPPLEGRIAPIILRDLGNFELAFVMLWAYLSFSQFLLVWYGNLLEEIPWYLKRAYGGWGMVALALVLFHFFGPFIALLMRGIKQRTRFLALVSVLILVMRAVDVIWLIAPAYEDFRPLLWMGPLAIIGIGGIWLSIYLWQLGRGTVVPAANPWVQKTFTSEAVNHG